MVIREIFSDPITRSDYNGLIKTCLRMWGRGIANSIGALIVEFRDNIYEHSNFKVTFCCGGTKYLTVKVKGGFGKLSRTKYRVDESAIKRYDWRAKFWETLKRIINFAGKVGGFLAHNTVRQALPYYSPLDY